MTGQSKVQLILELKNRMKTGLTKAKQSVNRNVSEIKGRFSDMKNKVSSQFSQMKDNITNGVDKLKMKHIEAFNTISERVPGVGSAVKLLAQPWALVTAGIVATIAASVKLFNHLMDVSLNIEKEAKTIKTLFKCFAKSF